MRRMPSKPRLTCSMAARRAWPRKIAGAWRVNQWLKKAVLLSFRLNDMSAHPRRTRAGARWCDKVAVEIRRLGREPFPRRRLPRRAQRHRAPLRLYRAGRRADAVLRQCRRLCRRAAPWSTPGRRSAPARRSARTATSRAAPASAACWSRCRPAPVIIEDNCFIGARSEVAEGVDRRRGLGAVDGRLSRRLDQDHRPRDRRGLHAARCRPIRSWCRAPCRASR